MTSEQIASLQPALAELLEHFRPYFKRRKTFDYWQTYLLGLMSDLKRKSIEPIALASGVPVRTLQEFLAFFQWDEQRAENTLHQLVADRYGDPNALGILDSSGHPKQGDKTPGVQRQYCGQTGKHDNCVVGQYLLYTTNNPRNPFSCMLCSDLYLPRVWAEDRPRCRAAGIPDEVPFRTKWEIAIAQVRRAVVNGIRWAWLVFDSDYGRIPAFWFELDRLGQRGVGEVGANFHCWAKPPLCASLRSEHASKTVKNLARYSPVFCRQSWRRIKVKDTTRGASIWRYKAARVQLVAEKHDHRRAPSIPTDRRYWLVVAENVRSGDRKYLISNAPADTDPAELLRVYLGRWHVEKWFERAKEETGLGAFEVRTYRSLVRHWLSSRIAMFFLAAETRRLRGEKSGHHSRAGCRRSQCVGVASVAAMADELGSADSSELLLPVA